MNNQTTEQLTTGKHFAEYKIVSNCITKDGHTMFPEDVVKDLDRKSHLEREILELRKKVERFEKFTKFQADVVINADAEIQAKDRRIAELEAELGFSYDKAIKDIQVHNLRQQAKGIEDAHKYIVDNNMFRCSRDYMKGKVMKLTQQADELEQTK